MLGAVLLHLLADGGGDHVARLQLVGKTLAGGIEQNRAFAAAALADQEGAARLRREQARGVNLHVVQVLHRNAVLLGDVAGVTGELRVVGRVVVYATDAARRPQRMAGVNLKRACRACTPSAAFTSSSAGRAESSSSTGTAMTPVHTVAPSRSPVRMSVMATCSRICTLSSLRTAWSAWS